MRAASSGTWVTMPTMRSSAPMVSCCCTVATKAVHFWMRFLQAGRTASQLDNAAEELGLKALSLLQPAPRVRAGANVRVFLPGDLAACHLLLDAGAQRHRLAQLWDTAGLHHELGAPDSAHTFVSSDGCGVQGFATSFHWPMKGRGRIPAEVIDLLIFGGLSAAGKRELLSACVAGAMARGAWVAVLPRPDFRDAATLMGCGFVPIPKVCTLVTLFPSAELDWSGLERSGERGALRFR